MLTGIVIPHETRLSIQNVEFQNPANYQTAVGGYIETVKMGRHPLVIVADEDGKVKHLPLNRRATCRWWLLNPFGLGGDFIVGEVVILGEERRGKVSDVPANLTAVLLEATGHEVQVCLNKQFNNWVPIDRVYTDYFDASVQALGLMELWDPPSEVRVVAAE